MTSGGSTSPDKAEDKPTGAITGSNVPPATSSEFGIELEDEGDLLEEREDQRSSPWSTGLCQLQ